MLRERAGGSLVALGPPEGAGHGLNAGERLAQDLGS